MSSTPSRAESLVALMARQIPDGDVVATGVASPLAILAIAVARATHSPNLTYLSCVGSLDPSLEHLFRASEDLGYLNGRCAEVSIPDLFDHARRGRVGTIFFGAAEIDAQGCTNLSAAGSLQAPKVKFPGVAGACSLRRWTKRPILVLPRQSRRNLVEKVQVASTRDDARRTRVLTDLATFEVSEHGATLVARQPYATVEEIVERTGFVFAVSPALETTALPDKATLDAIRRIDSTRLREELVT